MSSYHDIRAVSQSFLKAFDEDPRLAVGQYITGTIPPSPPTPAMEFGSQLEQLLWGNLVEIPEDVLTSNGHRRGKAWEAFSAEHKDSVLVKRDQMEPLLAAHSELQRHEEARAILFAEDGRSWVRHQWEVAPGIVAKAEIDRVSVTAGGHAVLADLKTAASNQPDDFAAAAFRFGYHRQAAWYQDAMEDLTGEPPPPFVFVVVKSSPSYSVETYELDEDFVASGREMNRRSLARWLACQEANEFDSPTHGTIITLSAPRWARYKDEYLAAVETGETDYVD